MPHLQTSAGRVAYSDTGSGPMLVLLHATLHDRHDYDRVDKRSVPSNKTQPDGLFEVLCRWISAWSKAKSPAGSAPLAL